MKTRLQANHSEWRLATLSPLLVAVLLASGCGTNGSGGSGSGSSSESNLAAAAQAATEAAKDAARQLVDQAQGSNAAVRDRSLEPLLGANVPPTTTRSPQALATLMGKGKVRGDELLEEMKAMRLAMRQQRTATAIAAFNGSVDKVSANPSASAVSVVTKLAVDTLMALIKEQALSVSYQALEQHMGTLIDDPKLLQQQELQMPSPKGLNLVQQQRAVTIGAILVMTRVTNKLMDGARKDFAGIEKEYLELLDRREKAATVLYQALARGGAAGSMPGLSAKDVEFLQGTLARMPLGEFARDLGAQNLALAYLERTDPGAFAAYKAQSQGVLGRARGLLRLTSGAVAFGAMVTVFTQQVGSVVRGKSGDEILALMPLAYEFAKEMPGLVQLSIDAGAEGAKLPFKANKRFRVGTSGSDAGGVELSSARDVFRELNKRNADPLLRDSLFRNGASGLLHKLYLCSPPEAGRMLDTAVATGDREDFAKVYFQREVPRFSFANSFEAGSAQASKAQQALDDEILRSDQRERTQDSTLALSGVQKKVAGGGYERWGDEQLMRLIFSNREGAAQYATLQLGETVVRPIASSQSVFSYESLVDLCRNLVQPARPAVPKPRVDAPRKPPAITPPPTNVRRPATAASAAGRN